MKYILAFLSLIIFGFYLNTAPPTIYMGDSGEIVAAAYNLGISHPPGYPLDMILGKISMIVPVGDIAFRMNLLSSLLAIICFIFMYLAGIEFLNIFFKGDIGKNSMRFTSLFVALMFVFSSMFWFEAIHAKGAIYVLANMLMILALFFALKNISTGNRKYFYATTYIVGFLLPAHNSTALFLIALISLLLYVNRKNINLKTIISGIAFFLLAMLTSYVYLFIRAKSGTPVNFGYLQNAGDVMNHIMRKVYERRFTARFDMGTYFNKIGHLIAQFVEKYNILVVFLFAGLYSLYSYSRKLTFGIVTFIVLNILLLVYVINTSAGFAINSMSSISLYASKNFYLMIDIIPIFLSMAGVFYLLKTLKNKYEINSIFIGTVLSFALILTIAVNYSLNNFSRTFMGYDHGLNINKTLNKGDVLWLKGDCPLFNLVYLQSVKSKFDGIKTYDSNANMLDGSIFKNVKVKIESSIKQVEFDIYNQNKNNSYYAALASLPSDKLVALPYGVIFKMSPLGTTTVDTLPISKLYSIRDYFNCDNQDLYYRDTSARYFVMRGRYAGLAGNREEADKWLKLAFMTAGASPEILNNIATVYYFSFGDVNTAIDYERKIYEMDPSDSTEIVHLIWLFKQVNPLRAIEYLNVLYNRSTDETEKANIKLEIDSINNVVNKH